jgi:hypothetical protein
MMADMIAKNNSKYSKYLEAKKCDTEGLDIAIFVKMDYKKFINEVVSAYIQDFEEDYRNLFMRNCAFVQLYSYIDISDFKFKNDKVIFYATVDGEKAYMEVEIIDILIGIFLLKDHTKVYDVINRELFCAPINYI